MLYSMAAGWVTLLLALLVAPPAWVAALGGADLDLGPWRVTWFEFPGPLIALAGVLLLPFYTGNASVRRRLGIALAWIGFAGVALVMWTPGIRTELIRVTSPLRPALLGWLGLALALPRRPAAPEARAWLTRAAWAAASLAGGAVMTWGVTQADRSDLVRRIAGSPASAPGPDVIMILIDTLRADALGVYGARPSPSPFVDALAGESVLFEMAVAQAPWTPPSVLALMTSVHPSTAWPTDSRARLARGVMLNRLPPDLPALGQRFSEAGFHTAGFVKNRLIGEGGFGQGFDVWELVGGDPAEEQSARQLTDAALRWAREFAHLRAADQVGAFLLYLHYMDPHINYQPPAAFVPPEARAYQGLADGSDHSLTRLRERQAGPSPEDVAYLRAMYQGEVAYLDSELARLRQEFSSLGLWSDATVVAFVGDHGEQFAEHDDFQHADLHIENVHVPLLIKAPGFAPRRVSSLVRLIDVMPTLAELFSLEPSPYREGRSLVPAMRGAELPPLPAITEYPDRGFRVNTPRYAIVLEPENAELFDMRSDPRETQNLVASLPAEAARLRSILARHERREQRFLREVGAPERPLDPKAREELQALGYVD